MTNLLQQEFNIHPVVQGLFYNGNIIHDNKIKFQMIFGCESKTTGAFEQEIDFLKEESLIF